MLEQAINEEIIQSNPSNKAVLPKMVKSNLHRLLEPTDLKMAVGHCTMHFYTIQAYGPVMWLCLPMVTLTSGNEQLQALSENQGAPMSFQSLMYLLIS